MLRASEINDGLEIWHHCNNEGLGCGDESSKWISNSLCSALQWHKYSGRTGPVDSADAVLYEHLTTTFGECFLDGDDSSVYLHSCVHFVVVLVLIIYQLQAEGCNKYWLFIFSLQKQIDSWLAFSKCIDPILHPDNSALGGEESDQERTHEARHGHKVPLCAEIFVRTTQASSIVSDASVLYSTSRQHNGKQKRLSLQQILAYD